MIYDWKMELYWRLPVILQEVALSLYGWRLNRLYYGGEFKTALQEVTRRTWRDRQEIDSWQMERLRAILASAVEHVPHYRERYRGIATARIRTIDDLRVLPLLDRQDVRQREERFVDERVNLRKLVKEKTSGSTGTAVKVFWPARCLQWLHAVIEVRVRYVGGVSQAVPRAMLGGRPIVRGSRTKPPFWRRNWYWKQLYLSSYHVAGSTASGYAAAIRRSGVAWLYGYGSAIAALAEGAMAAGVSPLQMKTVIVSGDTLQPGMRTSIERFFQCKCYNQYAQTEAVAYGMECPEGRMHLIPDVGIVEIVAPDGSPCAPGTTGEIVGTGLLNEGMPLIRYRTGDTAAVARDQDCSCGSSHPVIESLEGRVDDYLVTRDGRQIGRLSTAMKRSPTIHSAQIVQDRPGHAYLMVRPGKGYTRDDAVAVVDDVLERIGEFELDVREVAEIPKSPTGKTRLVVRLSERPDLWAVYAPLIRGARSAAVAGEVR